LKLYTVGANRMKEQLKVADFTDDEIHSKVAAFEAWFKEKTLISLTRHRTD
jgi:hypothetical protein